MVVVLRENHTFDDYLGDCATTIQAGCNGVVQGTNHISSVPNLHTLAKTYSLMDSYSTGTQPPSGPNHWWLFSGQSSSSSQQQSYPAATGTQFDRFLKGPSGGYPFIMNGDFYWMLNSGSGYRRNPATNAIGVLLATFPMTTADQSGLGDPLEDLWIQGATPLSATATATPTTGNAPLGVTFIGSATGGKAPYSYSWNFGDGSAAATSAEPKPHLQLGV